MKIFCSSLNQLVIPRLMFSLTIKFKLIYFNHRIWKYHRPTFQAKVLVYCWASRTTLAIIKKTLQLNLKMTWTVPCISEWRMAEGEIKHIRIWWSMLNWTSSRIKKSWSIFQEWSTTRKILVRSLLVQTSNTDGSSMT